MGKEERLKVFFWCLGVYSFEFILCGGLIFASLRFFLERVNRQKNNEKKCRKFSGKK